LLALVVVVEVVQCIGGGCCCCCCSSADDDPSSTGGSYDEAGSGAERWKGRKVISPNEAAAALAAPSPCPIIVVVGIEDKEAEDGAKKEEDRSTLGEPRCGCCCSCSCSSFDGDDSRLAEAEEEEEEEEGGGRSTSCRGAMAFNPSHRCCRVSRDCKTTPRQATLGLGSFVLVLVGSRFSTEQTRQGSEIVVVLVDAAPHRAAYNGRTESMTSTAPHPIPRE
jgi:hypothetical protein